MKEVTTVHGAHSLSLSVTDFKCQNALHWSGFSGHQRPQFQLRISISALNF
jgi:hypothetical protein